MQEVRRAGFTLIETIVVLVVIAVMATLVAPTVLERVFTPKEAIASETLDVLGASLDAYRDELGVYPTTAEGLGILAGDPSWSGPYPSADALLDPWGNPYRYRSPVRDGGGGYELISLGADGRPGGEGEAADLRRWEEG